MGKKKQESGRYKKYDHNPRGKLADYFRASGTSKRAVRDNPNDSDSDGVMAHLNVGSSLGRNERAPDRINRPVNCFGEHCNTRTSYYRSNITTAISGLKGVHLTPEHYRLLQGTAFYAFIRSIKQLESNALTKMLKKSDEAIRCVMARYDKPTGSFILECPSQCTRRCSKTQYHKPCMFFCQKCCRKCLCVPPGFYGNKAVCPCYNNWKTQQGGPKCP